MSGNVREIRFLPGSAKRETHVAVPSAHPPLHLFASTFTGSLSNREIDKMAEMPGNDRKFRFLPGSAKRDTREGIIMGKAHCRTAGYA